MEERTTQQRKRVCLQTIWNYRRFSSINEICSIHYLELYKIVYLCITYNAFLCSNSSINERIVKWAIIPDFKLLSCPKIVAYIICQPPYSYLNLYVVVSVVVFFQTNENLFRPRPKKFGAYSYTIGLGCPSVCPSYLFRPQPQSWGPIELGCPSVCPSVRLSVIAFLYALELLNGRS